MIFNEFLISNGNSGIAMRCHSDQIIVKGGFNGDFKWEIKLLLFVILVIKVI